MAGDKVDLYIIGLGVQIPEHISKQAARAMSRCAELYSIIQEEPALWLPPHTCFGLKVINLLEFYAEGRLRIENYQLVAKTIMNAAGPGKTLGYVTYGNPMSYDRVAQELVKHGNEARLTIGVVPGISSVDTLLCDLRTDMAPALQVFDASWFWACRIEPLPGAPMILMQVGAFGSLRTHYTQRQDGKSLKELVEYLALFYPRSHPVTLVRSTGKENNPARVRRVDLQYLCEVTAHDLSGTSLYIPASEDANAQGDLIKKMEEN
jgi:uncharacterized protein YabN with tetrapyrrole methylase and pyrophosphatase domain